MNIKYPRVLSTETTLAGGTRVRVAAPRSPHGQDAAKRIHRALNAMDVRSEVEDDPEGTLLTTADGPVIVVGNLADSRCVRMLYFRTLCATDLWYPGPAGYELRTLCDPFGSGNNIILLGYSDAEGALTGSRRLTSRLKDPIPHLKDLRITRLPLAADEVEEFRTQPLPDAAWQVANTMMGDSKGYLYYLTGEPDLGAQYRRAWQAVIECGFEKNEKIVQTHLYSLMRLLPWRLVEDMDLFSDEERLNITRFLYGWAQSKEGWHFVDDCPRTKRPHNPRQNHEMLPALALLHAADYFGTYFPGLSGPETWREVAHRTFEPYGSSWKPLCDGLCHGWWMSQPVMLEYALHDPTHRYFEEGGARRAAECAMAVVNNDGWLPTAGDCDLRRQFPGPSLRVAAAYYGDGRFRFVHDLAPPDRQFASLTTLPRAFDTGISPRAPEGMTGVTVVPVDPLVYHVWARDPDMALDAVTSPPAAPIERCFDKLAVRTGWALADDFLLIDGLGGGSHSYDDAGGIIEYSRLGVAAIVQEDGLVQSAPEHHSIVTVVRNGESAVIPAFAILEANETDAEGTVYLRIRSKDHTGSDWVRELHIFPGKCAVFVDTVTANLAGDFAVEAHVRTPTLLALDGREAWGTRLSPCVGEVDVRLESLCAPSQLSTIEEPIHLRYPGAREQARWRERYHTDEMRLTSFVARETASLKPGESMRLVHLVQVRGPGESILHLSAAGPDLFMSDGEVRKALRSFQIRLPKKRPSGMDSPQGSFRLRLFFEAQSQISALCPLADGSIAAGTVTGQLSLVNADGDREWGVRLKGPIRDMGVSTAPSFLLAAGHGAAGLTGFNRTGETLWTTEIAREPSPWPWWELPTPAPVQVAGGTRMNEAFFAVGCGDLQLRCFDALGREQWRWRYNEGVPGRVRVADVDGSGESQIVVGGEVLSDQSTCRILKPDGNLLADLQVEGWTSMLTALAFGEDRGRRLIACGANRGANLHLYELLEKGWKRRWMKRPGGQVTGIHILGSGDRIMVATSQGFLLCYDLNGLPIWHRLFDRAIRHLNAMCEGVLLVDDAGAMRRVRLSGEIEHMGRLPAPCSLATADEDGIFLACGSAVLRIPKG